MRLSPIFIGTYHAPNRQALALQSRIDVSSRKDNCARSREDEETEARLLARLPFVMALQMLEREDGEAQLDNRQDEHDAEEDGDIPKDRPDVALSLVIVRVLLLLLAEHVVVVVVVIRRGNEKGEDWWREGRRRLDWSVSGNQAWIVNVTPATHALYAEIKVRCEQMKHRLSNSGNQG